MTPPRIVLPWAPVRWMSPEPAKASASTSLLRDMPTIAPEDRGALVLQDLISLTVALDVISTWTKRLADDPTVLATLCQALRRFAHLSHGDDDTETLLALAESHGGRARVHLAERLARTLAGHRTDLQHPLTSPRSVGAAARRLEAATVLLIKEAILRLAAKDALDSRQL